MPLQYVVRIGGVIVGEYKHEPRKNILTDAVLCAGHADGTGECATGRRHQRAGL